MTKTQIIVQGKTASRKLSCLHSPASKENTKPGLFWLNGFRSDMNSIKAVTCARWAREKGLAMTQFDYTGHGESEGVFENSNVGLWLEDALAVFDEQTEGDQILIGSSMGGWIALLLILSVLQRDSNETQNRIKGAILIAPALNLTTDLMWDRMDESIRNELVTKNIYMHQRSADEVPIPITRQLIEEGLKHHLSRPLRLNCPVRILHGMQDETVPWQQSIKLIEMLEDADVQLKLIKDSEHRLSRPQDIQHIQNFVDEIISGLVSKQMCGF